MTQVISSYMLLFGIAILGATFAYYIKKDRKKQSRIWQEFLERERRASTTTKREFPSHLLLSFDWAEVPLPPTDTLHPLYEHILTFFDAPMVSLVEYSNTELKENFGINHFQKLITYEETFNYFLTALKNYALQLEAEGFIEQQQSLDRYCVSILDQTKEKNKN